MKLKSTDERFFGRDAEAKDLLIKQSRGAYITDSSGKKYIDFLAGWCVGNLGWGHEEMNRAIMRPHPTYVHPSLRYEPWAQLSQKLAAIAPGDLSVSYRATGGSEAVEAAMQIAMLYTKRQQFISIEDSYHGNTLGTLSIGASENRKKYSNLLPGCHKIEMPLDENALKKTESLLKTKKIAAFIMEPVITNIDVAIPGEDFMMELPRLCKKYGTLLVMDEVGTGFGRTGKLFASEHYGIEPDIICLSKGITGGYAGLGVAMTTEKIAKYIKKDFHFYSTYGWHPISVNAAMASIDQWIKYGDQMLGHVNALSAVFEKRLSEIAFKGGATINVKGLAIGIKLKTDRYAQKLGENCLEKGLLIQVEEGTLYLFPPLTIEKAVALKGLKILQDCA